MSESGGIIYQSGGKRNKKRTPKVHAMDIEEELVDYLRIDICIAGGLTEAKKIAAMAETHFIQILPHNPLQRSGRLHCPTTGWPAPPRYNAGRCQRAPRAGCSRPGRG